MMKKIYEIFVFLSDARLKRIDNSSPVVINFLVGIV